MSTRSLANIKVQVKLTGTLVNTLNDGSQTSVDHPDLNYSPSLENGVGALQADRGWMVENRTLSSGSSETIDLYTLDGIDIGLGAGKDAVGQEVEPYKEIVSIAIVNENSLGSAGQLEIEPGDTDGWEPIGKHTVDWGGALKGQGILFKLQTAANGFAVTPTSRNVKLTANGGDVTYSLYLLARSDEEESSSSSSLSSSSSSSCSSTSSSESAAYSSSTSSQSTSCSSSLGESSSSTSLSSSCESSSNTSSCSSTSFSSVSSTSSSQSWS